MRALEENGPQFSCIRVGERGRKNVIPVSSAKFADRDKTVKSRTTHDFPAKILGTGFNIKYGSGICFSRSLFSLIILIRISRFRAALDGGGEELD